jgi:hypothetical protein
MLGLFGPTAVHAQAVEEGQARTLLGGGISHGGFGAAHLRVGEVVGERSVFMGGEAAWVPNHRLILGVGLWALVSEAARVSTVPEAVAEGLPLRMGYAGVLVGYRIAPTAVVHPTARMLIGAGGLSTGDSGGVGDEDDAFLVAEPGFGVELNVAPFLRLGVGASYRWVAGVDLGGLRDRDLSGLTGEFSLLLGRF